MEDENYNQEEELLDLGEPLISWEVDEYAIHDRSRTWYVVMAILGIVLVVYSIATANFLFAVIILMIGVISLLSHFNKPDRVPVIITTSGLIIADMYYDFDSIGDFSIAYHPPEVSTLYLNIDSALHPLLSIPLEDVDPVEVRDCLLAFCPENLERTDETLTDMVKRVYKL